MRSWAGATLIGAALVCAAPAPASASDQVAATTSSPVVIESTEVDLDEGDDGALTATVVVSNLTLATIDMAAEVVTGGAGCTAEPNPMVLEPARVTKVSIEWSAACEPSNDALVLNLTFDGGMRTDVTASVAELSGGTASSESLAYFLYALITALLTVSFVYANWSDPATRKPTRRARRAEPAVNLWTPLPGLDAGWKFSDSWASNVTIGSAAVAGVLGSSDVLTSLVGEEPKDAVATTLVAAAVSAALVAAGPLWILATKKGENVRVVGLLVAAILTLTGALGQLWILTRVGAELDVSYAEATSWAVGVGGTLLLVAYATTSLRSVLIAGEMAKEKEKTEVEKLTDAIIAAVQTAGRRRGATPDEAADPQLEADVGDIVRRELAGFEPQVATRRSAVL